MIPSLCFVTDGDAPLSIPDQAERAARGGAAWVQLRHKTLDDASFADLARALIGQLAPLGVEVIINDRTEIARTIGAFGLHIGQSDGDPRAARARIGPGVVLGLSIEAEHQVATVPPGCVDYLGVGPIRATTSKPDHAPPIGWDGLARVAAATDLPCMAIGGLDAADTPRLQKAGARGLAIVSAISRAADPEKAARKILSAWSDT